MQRFTITFFIAGQASRFAHDENGATAIEYAMIAAGIGAAIVVRGDDARHVGQRTVLRTPRGRIGITIQD